MSSGDQAPGVQNLPSTEELEGADHGTSVCIIQVDMAPGDGVRLHRHPYAEIFIVQEGRATYRLASSTIEVVAPRILIVPAGTAHGFVNTGDSLLKQVDIHLSPKFITEWLEPGP